MQSRALALLPGFLCTQAGSCGTRVVLYFIRVVSCCYRVVSCCLVFYSCFLVLYRAVLVLCSRLDFTNISINNFRLHMHDGIVVQQHMNSVNFNVLIVVIEANGLM